MDDGANAAQDPLRQLAAQVRDAIVHAWDSVPWSGTASRDTPHRLSLTGQLTNERLPETPGPSGDQKGRRWDAGLDHRRPDPGQTRGNAFADGYRCEGFFLGDRRPISVRYGPVKGAKDLLQAR